MRNEKKIAADLSPQQRTLFDLVKRGKDTSIADMFDALWPPEPGHTPSCDLPTRAMQQRLAPVIAGLNAKLIRENVRLAPGDPRRTYRLRRA